jgi:hypothetical protein
MRHGFASLVSKRSRRRRAADAAWLARFHFMRYLNFTPQQTVYQRFVLALIA